MDNCLVTTLKGVINNDTLPILGRCNFVAENNRTDSSKTFQVSCPAGSGQVANAISGTFADGTTQKSFPANGGLIDITTAAKDAIVSLPKYKIDRMLAHIEQQKVGQSFIFTTDDLEYASELSYVTINYTAISGDIAKLSKCILLERLDIVGTNVTGNLEDLLEGFVANGKTLQFVMNTSSYIKLHGAYDSRSFTVTFSTDACTVKVSGTTVASYTKSGGWEYF